MKRLGAVCAVIIIFSMLLTSCAPAVTPAAVTVKETVIVEKPVEKIVTQQVQVEKIVTQEVIKTIISTGVPQLVVATPTAPPVPTKPVKGGVLRLGTQDPVVLWDPSETSDNNSLWAEGQVFETLARIGSDASTIEPDIAEKWDVTEGGKVWTFNIREGVKWSDGSPLTIQDVKFSLDRCRKPDAQNAWILEAVDKIDIVDPATLKMTLFKPSAGFLNYITMWACAILPEAPLTKLGNEEFFKKPIGSGPFVVADWVKGQRVVLKRNPNYWGKDAAGNQLPYLDEIDLEELSEDNTRVLNFMAGELDAITWVPYNLIDSLKKGKDLTVVVKPGSGGSSVALNQKVAALADNNVRQALNYATDRNAIVKTVFFGYATPKMSALHPGVWYQTEKYGIPFNLDKAKALMAASAFPKGFSAKLNIGAGNSAVAQIANILKEQWAKIGVDITINPLESGLAWDSQLKKNYDMNIGGIGTADSLEPEENFIYGFIIDGGAESGRTSWQDPEMQTLFRQSQVELDFNKRGQIYDQMQKIAMERGPYVPLFNAAVTYAYRTNTVHAFAILPTFSWRLWEVWVTK